MSHPNAQVVRELYDARATGDWQAVADLLAPDVSWIEPGDEHWSGERSGREAALDLVRGLHDDLDEFHLVPREVVADDGYAVAIVDWSARRGTEELAGREAAVFLIEDGRVTEARFYLDAPSDPEAFSDFWA